MNHITLNNGHGRRLDSERKPRIGNRKSLHRHRTNGIGVAKLKGLTDPGKGVSVWGPTLASQFWQDRGWKAEQALMAAVLRDALDVYRLSQRVFRDCPLQRAGQEAEMWLRSNDDTWPFSFLVICQSLNLNPDWIRAGIFGKEAA